MAEKAKKSTMDWLDDAPMPPPENMPSTSAAGERFQPQYFDPFATSEGYENYDDIPFLKEEDDVDMVEVFPIYDQDDEQPSYSPVPPTAEDFSWISVFYFEDDKRVGEVFTSAEPLVTIDGFTAEWTKDRMCISLNPVMSQSPKCDVVRSQFHRGIQIFRRDTKVILRCLTTSPIFVQSPQRALMHGEALNTVYRLQSIENEESCEFTLFDGDFFDESVARKKHCMDEDFYAIHNQCISRLSIIKGFGSDYPRKLITETPCWMEIHMNYKLREFDAVLRSGKRQFRETLDDLDDLDD
ncbi:unnamed protein product [Caenorhabditis angaria]|uniref:MH2 domain-containing protein n=1 Tax=Caenorhabditis angaria TaxID=860376 RepID=A0A9P1ISL2_9PELO|nr:unnamed protein product [Caenorhabditis angaria]